MRDPKHGRVVPLGRDLALMLRRWFAHLGQRAAAQIIRTGRIDLSRFVQPMAVSLLPIVEAYWRAGANRAQRDILRALAKRREAKQPVSMARRGGGGHAFLVGKSFRPRIKRGDPLPQLLAGFDVLNPYVQAAITAHVYQFAQETLDTAESDAIEAYEQTSESLSTSLELGETQQELTRRIVRVFADPVRAHRIAATESSYSVHRGEIEQAKTSGIVKKVRWLASADACPLCLAIDGKEVEIDHPFVTGASKNPKYATIFHAPRHPNCMCTNEMIVE